MSDTIRPCEKLCPNCERWKHHSRFRTWSRAGELDRTLPLVRFASLCRDCEQIKKNERKNADRPLDIIQRRTGSHARSLGVRKSFLWVNMNWSSLVPEMRALMTSEGVCRSCGHEFVNERDIQIEHREPPRFRQDWAREHARNLGIFCQSCNNGKGNKPYAQWLEEQEEARLSNEHHRSQITAEDQAISVQLTLSM